MQGEMEGCSKGDTTVREREVTSKMTLKGGEREEKSDRKRGTG